MGLVSRLARVGKVAAFGLSGLTGLTAAVGNSHWRRQRMLVLCYHGVSLADEHEWSDLYVSAAHLRRRFSYLRREGYQVLPLGEALTALDEGSLPPRAVVLTFDDGAYDFRAQAYPLLQEFGFHATLYQTTYYCAFQRPVFDTILSYLLWKGQGRPIQLPETLGGAQVVPSDRAQRLALHLGIRQRANASGLSASAKDELAHDVAGQVGVDYDTVLRSRLLHLMTPEEVAGLDARLVSVQLHTHRHRTPRVKDEFLRELSDNRDALEAMRPGIEPLEHFCYPSGDYDRRFLPWLVASGVKSATTCDPGLVGPGSERLLLPRLIDTMETPDRVFEAWLAGVASFLPRRRS